MKALRYLAPNVAKTENIEEPHCGKDEALIRVHSAGICGTDLTIFAGKHPRAKAPLVMGHEFAGEIVEIKSSKIYSEIVVGDKVTVYPLLTCGHCWACRNEVNHVCRNLKLIGIDRDGAFAEYVNVPLDLILKYPKNLTYDQGALIEPLAVGVHAVEMAGEFDWQTAVVIGSGPIGLLVALCLRQAGIETIITSDINAYRLNRSKKLGFTSFNSAEHDLVEFVNEVSRGEGADIVFECAGSGPAALQMCELVRPRGKVVVVSTHKEPQPVDLQRINFREITMIGTRVYTRNSYQKALQMIKSLPLDELISHRLDIGNAVEGFELMQKPEDVCKVIINIS
jgi:threonine dehydrogenase-like Zn-dependent dehydrogenase